VKCNNRICRCYQTSKRRLVNANSANGQSLRWSLTTAAEPLLQSSRSLQSTPPLQLHDSHHGVEIHSFQSSISSTATTAVSDISNSPIYHLSAAVECRSCNCTQPFIPDFIPNGSADNVYSIETLPTTIPLSHSNSRRRMRSSSKKSSLDTLHNTRKLR
jgi:hypothetical protein